MPSCCNCWLEVYILIILLTPPIRCSAILLPWCCVLQLCLSQQLDAFCRQRLELVLPHYQWLVTFTLTIILILTVLLVNLTGRSNVTKDIKQYLQAYAAVKFADACLQALRGDPAVVHCAYVASEVCFRCPFLVNHLLNHLFFYI